MALTMHDLPEKEPVVIEIGRIYSIEALNGQKHYRILEQIRKDGKCVVRELGKDSLHTVDPIRFDSSNGGWFYTLVS